MIRLQSARQAMMNLGLATLTLLTLLQAGAALHVEGQHPRGPWPLTSDGRSRVAGWSPDSGTVLANRWGRVVGDGATRQALSELWAITVQDASATKLSDNGIYPAWDADSGQVAYLATAEDGGWHVRVLTLLDARERSYGPADWQMPPAWVHGTLAVANSGRVWLRTGQAATSAVDVAPLPASTWGRLSHDGGHIAWSDGTGLWTAPTRGAARGAPRLLTSRSQILGFAWSPKGQKLAYIAADEGPLPELWVSDVDSGHAPALLVSGSMEWFSLPSWSPDGRTLAFSRTPTGAASASASDIWLVNAGGDGLHQLLHSELEESSPVWSPDGRYLAFNRGGDVWVLETPCDPGCATLAVPAAGHSEHRWRPDPDPVSLSATTNGPMLVLPTQKTPPATIRVIHDAANPCRQVPVGRIDVIDFENYVRRVVPQEMPPSWAAEALKAQAVAARTYAWKQVLMRTSLPWDVTDWTSYQAMCDVTYSSTNSAAEATRGQYVAWRGEVVYAMYSAENGNPTRTYTTATFPHGVPYLMAVEDPVSFNQPVRGHGAGLSQYGAKRWAEWHGWGYQQILRHYYTDVTVELPSTAGPMPLGALTLPWSDHYATGNRVYLAANASDELSAVSAVGFYLVTDTTTLLVTDTVASDGWSMVWDAGAMSDTASPSIGLSLLVADGGGHVQSQTEAAHIGLDRQSPTGTLTTSSDSYTDTLSIVISSLSAADPSPGSGAHAMAFSNDTWAWEGEDLPHEAGSGEEVDDELALNGRAWCGRASQHNAGSWYGPYTRDLPPGRLYRAYFRLRTSNPLTPAEVAGLDVVDDAGERVLGLHHVRGTDFRGAGVYQEFPVDFSYGLPGSSGLEFRTAFQATADLCLDRVLIVSYPVELGDNFEWELTAGDGPRKVTAKLVDRAGNVSADMVKTVTIVDTRPPENWQDFAPAWWAGGGAPSFSVRVTDETSGLNVDSAAYRLSTDRGTSWSDWITAACTGSNGTTAAQTITAQNVDFDRPRESANHIEFQISDMTGHMGSTSYVVHSRLLHMPLLLRAAWQGPP